MYLQPGSQLGSDAGSAMRAHPIPVSAELAAVFQHPHMVWLRIVEKQRRRGGTKQRVLLLTTRSIYLCHLDGHVTRWLRYQDIAEAVVHPRDCADAVLLRAVPPEHDMLVYLCDHVANIPVHTTADGLTLALHRAGVRIAGPWQGSEQELLESAELRKRAGYVSPAYKLKDMQQQNQSRASSQPRCHSAQCAMPGQPPSPPPPPLPLVQHSPPQYPPQHPQQYSQQHPPQHPQQHPQQHLPQPPPQYPPQPPHSAAPAQAAGGWAPPGPTRALLVCLETQQHGGAQAAQQRSCDFLQRHSGGDVRLLGGRSEEPVTRDSLCRALEWLVGGCRDGDSLWLTLAVPAANGSAGLEATSRGAADCGLLPGPGGVPELSSAELWATLVRPLPAGARLTVLADTAPACPALLPLPFILASALGGASHTARREVAPAEFPEAAAEVVVLSAAEADAGETPQGAVAGAFLTAAGEGLSHRGLVERARRVVAQQHGECSATPLITCSRPLAPDAPFHLHAPPTSAASPSQQATGSYRPPEQCRPSQTSESPCPLPPPQPLQESRFSVRSPQLPELPAAHHADVLSLPPPLSPSPGPGSQLGQVGEIPALPVPLQAPFADLSLAPQTDFPPQLQQDEDFWRNLVCHAFLLPSAFDQPHIVVSSSHTGTQLRLNQTYVSCFVDQWPRHHPLLCHVRMTPDEGRHVVARSFYASRQFWDYLSDELNRLLGQRAVQRLLYPHAKDAARGENVVITVDGLPSPEEPVHCHFDDWVQAVSAWEQERGFSFTKSSLPTPLMPPFPLPRADEAERAALAHDKRIATSLQRDLSDDGGEDAAKSVSFQYDADFVRNLAYHSRVMPGARQPPLFIVEDTGLSHPLLINQQFLCRYVLAWGKVHQHMVWVHEREGHMLVARCRANDDFWRFLCERGPRLQAQMGGGRLVSTTAADGQPVCRLAMHLLTITSSASPEALTLWDGVWCAVLQEWESALPQPEEAWSPRRHRVSNSPPRSVAAGRVPLQQPAAQHHQGHAGGGSVL